MLDLITKITHKIEKQAANAGFVFRLASGYYKDVIEREVQLANIAENDNILCIGGGICPFSAILLHRRTGAQVTVIDNNHSCIPKAQEVVRRLGLCAHISVMHQDGTSPDVPFADFSVIHLALQLSPMEAVFAQAAQNAKVGARLLIRRPKKHLANMYCPSFTKALDGQPYTAHNSSNIGCTLLYIKTEENNV